MEIVFSSPLSSTYSLRNYDQSLLDNKLNSNFYKRNQMYEKRAKSLVPVGRRGVVPTGTILWPDGVIPYDLSNIKNKNDQKTILEAMKMITDDTAGSAAGQIIPCITFRKKSRKDKAYVTFYYSEEGCYTNGLGYAPGDERTVNLEKDSYCFTLTTIQHEIMHVLGFDHEHKRPDRDDYITVDLNKIDPDWLEQYQKYGQGSTVDLLTPYDVNSIMHYYASDEMQSKDGVGEIKRLGRLSPIDVKEVRTLYSCKG